MKNKIKLFAVYKISRGYTRMTMWEGRCDTHERICYLVLDPNKNLSRRAKYEVICDTLKAAGIPLPTYK